MRLHGASGLRVSVTPRRHNPPVVEVALGPLTFSMPPDEALKLADRLVDAVERIRQHPNGKDTQ